LMGGTVPIKLLPNRKSLRLNVPLFEDTLRQKTFHVTIKGDDEVEIESVTVHPTKRNYRGRMIRIIFVDVPVANLTDKQTYEFAMMGLGSIRFTIQH
jgi:hypothetical protein